MILKVIMITLAISITFYTFFTMFKCRDKIIHYKQDVNIPYHNMMTYGLSKVTLSASIVWVLSQYVLYQYTKQSIVEENFNVSLTWFIIVSCVLILMMLMYRNHMYKKYLKDNIVKVLLIDYSLAMIFSIFYAHIMINSIFIVMF